MTPADKVGGQGPGAYYGGDFAVGSFGAGVPSSNGDRFIALSFAYPLTAGSFLYQLDYALATRTDAGWTSQDAFDRHEYSPTGGASGDAQLKSATADFERLNFGSLPPFYLFPEMANWPINIVTAYVRDWRGGWELIAPTGPTQGPAGTTLALSADGQTAVETGDARGMAGAEDPSQDQLAGSTAAYVVDLSSGLSDAFPTEAHPRLIGICTGSGTERTTIPSRLATAKQDVQPCPDTSPGRSASLINPRGAAVGRGANASLSSPTASAVSADGARTFFNSPDPQASNVPAICSTTGTPTPVGPATNCPTQLYVNQRDWKGQGPTVRWLSRTRVPNQDASLLGRVYFEGASKDGATVFFRTNSPLTPDDRNGTAGAPVTTGALGASSWDLYRYRFPADPDADLAGGDLTRISAGPLGTGDGNVSVNGTPGALRFASDDGSRVYFTSTAPLPGVPAPTDGTSTVPGGTATNTTTTNLYLYDEHKPLAQRWEFVALLPKATSGTIAACATTGTKPLQPLGTGSLVANSLPTGYTGTYTSQSASNCLRGTTDGRFLTFWTAGKLIASDPDTTSGDIYAFDAASDQLTRISAPQGGAGMPYPCQGPTTAPTVRCYADQGFVAPLALANVVTHPDAPRTAYFQSKARLVPEDTNDEYDVYTWKDGTLSLLSSGTSSAGAYYAGSSDDGDDVFIATTDRLSWQDQDAVMDVYDARVGGGIPEPSPPPAPCSDETCHTPPAAPPALPAAGSSGDTAGNRPAPSPAPSTRTVVLTAPGATARKSWGRSGAAVLTLHVTGGGPLTVRATGTVEGRTRLLGSRTRTVKAAARTTVQLKVPLNAGARAALKRTGRLRITFAASLPEARTRRLTVTLTAPKQQPKTAAKRGGRS